MSRKKGRGVQLHNYHAQPLITWQARLQVLLAAVLFSSLLFADTIANNISLHILNILQPISNQATIRHRLRVANTW